MSSTITDSSSFDSRENWKYSNDRTASSGDISTSPKDLPPPSRKLPRPGEIWKGRDLDGITEYEILILSTGDSNVTYAFAYRDSSFISEHSASLSIFLALYSPRSTPCPSQVSPSKTSWLKRLRSFFVSGKP